MHDARTAGINTIVYTNQPLPPSKAATRKKKSINIHHNNKRYRRTRAFHTDYTILYIPGCKKKKMYLFRLFIFFPPSLLSFCLAARIFFLCARYTMLCLHTLNTIKHNRCPLGVVMILSLSNTKHSGLSRTTFSRGVRVFTALTRVVSLLLLLL